MHRSSHRSRTAHQEAAETLKITALGIHSRASDTPAGLAFQEHIRALVVDRTAVACDWPVPPRDWTIDRLIASARDSGRLPHVLAVPARFEEPTTRTALLGGEVAHEITTDLLKRHMPLYCARLRQYGRSVEEVLTEHRHEGRNRYVPVGFGFGEFPDLVDHRGAWISDNRYYLLCFRDDVLRRVFPRARTEAELQDLFIHKGSLDIGDIIGDIPLACLRDLRGYLKAVKSLGLTEGERPIMPGCLTAVSDPTSLTWSLCTAAGYFWSHPFLYGDPPAWDRTTYFLDSEDGRNYLRWWNRAYRDGLIDSDMFELTNEQLAERQRQGRYAVINNWYWASEAREAARRRGYGYRSFPVFYGRWQNLWGNYACSVARQEYPLVFTRRIDSRTKLARVMRWADWHLGEERDVLAHWGVPEWYTGSGTGRRFSWDRHALEDWAVYGVASDDDGDHVGLEHTPASAWNPVAASRAPAWPFSFFSASAAYPEAPVWVYRWEPRKLLTVTDLPRYCERIIDDARCAEHRLVYRGDPPSVMLERLPAIRAFSASEDEHGDELRTLLTTAVTNPPEKFEAAYRAYVGFLRGIGIEQCRQAAIAYLRDIWPGEVEPSIVVDRR